MTGFHYLACARVVQWRKKVRIRHSERGTRDVQNAHGCGRWQQEC